MGLFWNRDGRPGVGKASRMVDKGFPFTTYARTPEREAEVRDRYIPFMLAGMEEMGFDPSDRDTLQAISALVMVHASGRVAVPGLAPRQPPSAPRESGSFRSMWDLNHDLAQREMNVAGRASWPSGRVMTDRELAEYGVRR